MTGLDVVTGLYVVISLDVVTESCTSRSLYMMNCSEAELFSNLEQNENSQVESIV